MELHQLRYFLEIARQENFTHAAEVLHITQPMLTRVVKQLERELGMLLIERTSKSFRLTDAGELFAAQARELLLAQEDLVRRMHDLKEARTGEVRLSIPSVLLDAYFPTLLTEFGKAYPGIRISIVEEGSKPAVKSVLHGDADLALVMLPVSNADELVSHTVLRDVCRLVVAESHPFAGRDAVSVPELAGERLITFSDTATLHDALVNLCATYGFVPNLVYKSFLPRFIFEMVSHGDSVAVLPDPIIRKHKAERQVAVLLTPTLPWEIAVIHKRDRYQTFAAERLRSFLYDYFDEM